MMNADTSKMIGSIDAILAALLTCKIAIADDGTVTCSTDTSAIDAERAKMNELRAEEPDPRFRDRILHSFQHREYALGAWNYSVSTNIYGWAAGDSLRSNIGGGRWAQTPRGWTLAQVIEWGCRQAQSKNVTFRFSLKHLPEDFRQQVELVASAVEL